MSVTNAEILAYLVDLSANIAQQFAEVNAYLQSIQLTVSKTDQTVTLEFANLYNDLSNNFAQVNTELALIDNAVASCNTQIEGVSKQVSDVQGYLESEINTGLILNIEGIIEVKNILNLEVIPEISQQTNTINTHTNEALSDAVNAINTNTNAAVGEARDNVNAHINPLLLNKLPQK